MCNVLQVTQPAALDQQLCFSLYAAARAAQQVYRPLLDELGLTYPQYLVLLALWEQDGLGVSELGERLYLDSGTLSPLLRRLEARGAVERRRTSRDGRQVTIHLTDEGDSLRGPCRAVQDRLSAGAAGGQDVGLSPQDLDTLRDLARRLADHLTTHKEHH